MDKLQLRNIRIYVWLFLILVLIIPFLIGAGLTVQLDSNDFQDQIISAVSSQLSVPLEKGADQQPVKSLLREIQIPLLSILLFILAGNILALALLYRYLLRPINQMTSTAHRIIEGNLDVSMPENSCHEVNELGRAFNDLSINLQEIILLVWNYLRDSSEILDQALESEFLQGDGKISSPMRHDLVAIREEMKTLENVVTSFNLYDVQIINQRAMAGPNTLQEGKGIAG